MNDEKGPRPLTVPVARGHGRDMEQKAAARVEVCRSLVEVRAELERLVRFRLYGGGLSQAENFDYVDLCRREDNLLATDAG
jgi:hypothetical protein